MKYFLSLFLLFGTLLSANAQTITFTSDSDKVMVTKGTMVQIEADTAFIIGKARAMNLNRQLDELMKVKGIYNGLLHSRNELVEELSSIQKILEKLLTRIEKDSAYMSDNLSDLITDIDKTLLNLKQSNESLAKNNQMLTQKANTLKKLVKALRKETRWIWWNGLADKIVVFGGGVGVGAILALLLI